MLLYRDNYKDDCIYTEKSTEGMRRKYKIFADYFGSYCRKKPTAPDPSG